MAYYIISANFRQILIFPIFVNRIQLWFTLPECLY